MEKFWTLIEKILYFVVYKMLRLKLSDGKWQALLQFVKFGVVGVSNTVVSYVLYVVTLLLLQKYQILPSADYLAAQAVAFVLSVLWSFYWNRKYVFQADTEAVPWPQALLKTYLSYAFTGLFLNSILSILWVQVLGVSKLIAPIFNLVFSVPINFLMNKFWAFRGKK